MWIALAVAAALFQVLREKPTTLGVTGVLLSTLGVYLLNVNRARRRFWEPLTVLFTDRGQRDTRLAACFYAPSVITIKQAILASSAAMGTLGGYVAASALMTPVALATSRRQLRSAVIALEGIRGAWSVRRAHDDQPGSRLHAHALVVTWRP